jgi:thioredoxin-related protein
MKAILWFLLAAMLSGRRNVGDQGVSFDGSSWQQVLQKAKREKKMIFLDCYASWCGPCKLMDQNVYSSDRVAAFFNERFICVKLQMDTSKKDGQDIQHHYEDAHDILVKYGVKAYPTFLFFDADGKAVHRGVGYQDTVTVIKMGLDAMDPGKQYYTLKGKYEKEEWLTPSDFMLLAWTAKRLEGDEAGHRIAKAYIDGLSHDALMDSVNLEFMYFFTSSMKDRGFSMFKDSAAAMVKVLPRLSVEVSHGLVVKLLYDEEVRPFETSKEGKPDWDRIKGNLEKYGPIGRKCMEVYRPKLIFGSVVKPVMKADPNWEKTLALIEQQRMGEQEKYLFAYVIQYYETRLKHDSTEDIRDLFACGKYYLDHFTDVAKAPQHNEIAFEIFKRDTVRDDLEVALQWGKYSVDSAEMDDPWKPDYLDTYANLLYKLGQRREAIGWEEKAVTARPKDKLLVDALEKMKAGKPTW